MYKAFGKRLIDLIISIIGLPFFGILFIVFAPIIKLTDKGPIFYKVTLLDSLQDKVYIHGRIPQDQVEEKLRDSDFSIFLRPVRKSSDAGFPTKFAESLMVATPVITNITGDIGLFLHDGVNGYVVKEPLSISLEKILENIISLTPERLGMMRKQARYYAEKNFDFRVYKSNMKIFLEEIKKL